MSGYLVRWTSEYHPQATDEKTRPQFAGEYMGRVPWLTQKD